MLSIWYLFSCKTALCNFMSLVSLLNTMQNEKNPKWCHEVITASEQKTITALILASYYQNQGNWYYKVNTDDMLP